MSRQTLRRLTIIPAALGVVNFLGYAYAYVTRPLRAARIPYFYASLPESGPLLPSYLDYLKGLVRLDLGTVPVASGGREFVVVISQATVASLGLLILGLVASVGIGLLLGFSAVRSESRGTARWLTLLSTVGLAMPSFYIGGLLVLVVVTYISSWNLSAEAIIPIRGFGWDRHLILPILALMVRPLVQIAQVTAGLLETELGKRYVVTARSIGHPWKVIRRRHAFRNILAPVVLTVAGSFRLLMGELILVEWLFDWPGLGRLLALTLVPTSTSQSAGSALFLDPAVVATVLTTFAALFLLTDLVASSLVQRFDPRLRDAEQGGSGSNVVSARSRSTKRNWALLIGGSVVLLVALAAVAGPALAPHDPLEEFTIVQVGDGWEVAPLPAFTVSGFPLGSDEFGRDLLSRLLWAVRPTMLMVSIVALVRLVSGTLVGLASGWSSGWLGRVLDTAITGALTVPILIVALGAIAAVGIEMGLLAFIVGLAVTGWADTARIMREQTKMIKGQTYIEAAHALGHSSLGTLFRHVLPQVMPMAWMLFAFEISGTLVATAGLGFLGYYIGGDVWVEVADFVARRISGMPELGQMLASYGSPLTFLTEPWPMIVVTSAVFFTVLGFNLLGEGLRRELDSERAQHTVLRKIARWLSLWLEEQEWLSRLRKPTRRLIRIGVAVAGVSLVVLVVILWRGQASEVEPAVMLDVPGGHLWASDQHDPYGTLQSSSSGPRGPNIRWTFAAEDGSAFAGGPAVAKDGTLYVASEAGKLYALDPAGNLLWQATLSGSAAGTPALGESGDIYVAGKNGSLLAFAPGGELRWRLDTDANSVALTGPIVDPGGVIYYPMGSNIFAVSSRGELLWKAPVPANWRVSPPQLGPNGDLLFWDEVVLDLEEGVLRELDVPLDSGRYKFMVGADGRHYVRAGNIVMEWNLVGSTVEIVRTANWNYQGFLMIRNTASDAGVTRQGMIWLFYTNLSGTRVAWLDPEGRVLGTTGYPISRSRVIGIDDEGRTYVCGVGSNRPGFGPECRGLEPGLEEPLWQLELNHVERIDGGALVPGRLYVTAEIDGEGVLYALVDPATVAEEPAETQTEVGGGAVMPGGLVWAGRGRDYVCVSTIAEVEAAITQDLYPCYCPAQE